MNNSGYALKNQEGQANKTMIAEGLELVGLPILLCAIHPDTGNIAGRYFTSANRNDAVDWAFEKSEAGFGVYWHPNLTRPALATKAKKSDIVRARFVHADLDPPKGTGAWTLVERAAVLEALDELPCAPSFVVSSGAGLHAYWRLDGECENLSSIETINQGVRDALGADAGTWNIDRILRVPGTWNLPNAKKRESGRQPALTEIVRADTGEVFEAHQLAASFPLRPRGDTEIPERDVGAVQIAGFDLTTLDELGLTDSILSKAVTLPKGTDGSGDTLHAACEMVRCGFSDTQIAGVLLNPANPISTHCLSQSDPQRAARRAIARARADEGIDQGAMAFIGDWPAMTAKLVENWNRKHAARKPLQAANDGVLRTVPEGGLVARKGITARDLMQKDFPPVTWIVPNIAPEGLTILAGAPKVGKSWLALGIAVAVAEGTETLGGIKCDRGRVLYLALEDNQRRLAGRMRMMGKALGPEKLDLMTEWPMVGEGCVEEMEIWADSHPDARLIVVDVFAKVKSSKGGSKPQYELDYKDVSALQHFAIERGLGLILVHHTRKMESDDPFDSVSGTRGLTGSADSTIVLTKGFGNENSGLYGRGRDIEEFEKTVLFDRTTCQWRIAGNIIAPAATPEQQAILDVLSDADEPMAAGDIARAVGKSSSNTSQLLTKLIEGGRVAKVAYGKFAVAAPGNLAFLREPQV